MVAPAVICSSQSNTMIKACAALAGLLCSIAASAQTTSRTGIGLTAPRARLHVQAADSVGLLVDNSTALATGVTTGLSFKVGNYYTGRIRTYGTATNYSSMGFFTFAVPDSSLLKERMTITDAGLVGIGITTPARLLDVAGTFGATGDATLGGNLSVAGASNLYTLTTSSNATLGGNLSVAGIATAGSVITSGNASINGSVTSGGPASMLSTLTVVGTSYLSTVGTSGNLNVGGNLMVAGGGPAPGKVLTATSTGGATTWANPESINTGVRAIMNSNQAVSAGATVPVAYNSTAYNGGFDDGANFSSASNAFIAPTTGVYLVTVSVVLVTAVAANSNLVSLSLNVNNSVVTSSGAIENTVAGQALPREIQFTRLVKLSAGDALRVQFYNATTATINLYGGSGTELMVVRMY